MSAPTYTEAERLARPYFCACGARFASHDAYYDHECRWRKRDPDDATCEECDAVLTDAELSAGRLCRYCMPSESDAYGPLPEHR